MKWFSNEFLSGRRSVMSNVAEGTNSSGVHTDATILRQKAVAAKDAVADLATELKSYAGDRFAAVRGTTVDKVQDAGESVVDFIQQNPYKAIGIAAGVGLLLGLILKRR
jgi:ElaB/YqjD/DUF883 family membrane-anchored ribosome-binding protein